MAIAGNFLQWNKSGIPSQDVEQENLDDTTKDDNRYAGRRVVSQKLERMVLALRQACIHPQIGVKGLRAKPRAKTSEVNQLFRTARYRRNKMRPKDGKMFQIGGQKHQRKVVPGSESDPNESLSESNIGDSDSEQTDGEGNEGDRCLPDSEVETPQERETKKWMSRNNLRNKALGEVPRFMSTGEVLNRLLTEARVRDNGCYSVVVVECLKTPKSSTDGFRDEGLKWCSAWSSGEDCCS